MAYRLTDAGVVIRLADGAFIPADPDNRDRTAFEAWLAEGGELQPYVAPEPPPVRVLTVLQFRDRLTLEEEITITQASMENATIRVWLDRLAGAQEVNLDDPRTIAGLQSMEAAGLLAPGRATEILA